MQEINTIYPRCGTSFILKKDQQLKIIDLEGEQVCDLMCYNLNNKKEYLSSGRTIDYNEKIYFSEGDKFYSNHSNVMFEIVEDRLKCHDFLLTPCSKEMFKIIYNESDPHFGCFENLCHNLEQYGIEKDNIHTTFNIFMNVKVKEDGKIKISAPPSKAGDYIIIKANMDLIVGLTACSDKMTNNYALKPIGYSIID